MGGLGWEFCRGGGQHHSIQMFLLQPVSPESLKAQGGGGGGGGGVGVWLSNLSRNSSVSQLPKLLPGGGGATKWPGHGHSHHLGGPPKGVQGKSIFFGLRAFSCFWADKMALLLYGTAFGVGLLSKVPPGLQDNGRTVMAQGPAHSFVCSRV